MKKYDISCSVLIKSKFNVEAVDKKEARKLVLAGRIEPYSDEIIDTNVTEILEIENESDDSE